MPDHDPYIFLQVFLALSVIGGAWLAASRAVKGSEKEKAKEIQDAVDKAVEAEKGRAHEELEAMQLKLDSRIDAARAEIENLRASFEKDIQHIRETYNGEVKNLGQKLEDLRTEVRNQHGQLVSLITKLIETSR